MNRSLEAQFRDAIAKALASGSAEDEAKAEAAGERWLSSELERMRYGWKPAGWHPATDVRSPAFLDAAE